MISTDRTSTGTADRPDQGTVLVVDDEPAVLTALTRLLRPDGVRVLTAASGSKALALLEKEAPTVSVVISDYAMPAMNGAELLRTVRVRWPDLTRVMLTGNADLSAASQAVNEGQLSRLYMKPWQPDEFRQAVTQALEQHWMLSENRRLRALADEQAARLEQWNQRLEELVAQRTAELEEANAGLHRGLLESVRLLVTFLQWRFPERASRARQVARLAGRLGARLELPPEEVRRVQVAALVHDVGLLKLSDAVVRRPPSTLPPAERAQYEQHPSIGHSLLSSVEPLTQIGRWVRHHHERWDGKGYPDGLVGQDIPLPARLIAVANDYLEAAEREGRTALLWRQEQRQNGAHDPELLVVLNAEVTRESRAAPPEQPRRVVVADLQPGMMLGETIHSVAGAILVPAGQRLSREQVERIHKLVAQGTVGTDAVEIA